MNNRLISFFFLSCSLMACRPDDDTLTPANSVWGTLEVSKTSTETDDHGNRNTRISEHAYADFYQNPANQISTMVNEVKVNGTRLNQNIQNFYTNDISTTDSLVVWTVNGAGATPSFTFNAARPYPRYSGPNLPDTLKRASEFTMNFPAGTCNHCDSVGIALNKPSRTSTTVATLYKAVGNDRSIAFSSQELDLLADGFNLASINLCNVTYQSFNGKRYAFYKRMRYTKYIYFVR